MSGPLSEPSVNAAIADARVGPRLIQRCGAIARRILREDGEARVVAVMTGAFYVALRGHDVICIGSRRLGNGPINVELAAVPGDRLAIDSGMTGSLEAGVLRLGPDFVMAVCTGTTWAPQRMPPFDARLVSLGLRRLRASAGPCLPADGLATIVLGERPTTPSSPLSRAACGLVEQLEQGLPSAVSRGIWPGDALAAAVKLLGLGPGLTPSGDDLLGGVMLALAAAGCADLRRSLWQAIEPRLVERTSPISAAHLRAAAEGMVAEPLHDVLGALLRGDTDDLEADLDAISAVGHTSGWDALSGLVIGLAALSEHERASCSA